METLLGFAGVGATVVLSLISFTWWLGRRLTHMEATQNHFFSDQDKSHTVIDENVKEIKVSVKELAADQADCRQKLVRIDTQVDMLCGGNGDGDG